MTATRRPRRSSPGWAMTALRGAIRILRYVNETLVLVLQALFPPAGARRPRPAADAPAERHAHLAPVPEYGRPGSGGPGAGPGGARSRCPQAGGRHRGRGPCGSRVVARPVRPRPAAGRRAASGGDSSGAGSIFELVSRIDGAKMLSARHRGRLGDRPRPPGRRVARLDGLPNGVLAVPQTGSGAGYLLLSLASGTLVPAIARLVAADEDTVRDVIHAFNQKDLAALDPQWAGGRPRLISDLDVNVIVAAARTRPEKLGLPFTRWSLRKLAAWTTCRRTRPRRSGPGPGGPTWSCASRPPARPGMAAGFGGVIPS